MTLSQQSLIQREVARLLARNSARTEELKYAISTVTDANISYPTSTFAPTVIDGRVTIARGTDQQSRLGEHVRLKSYSWKARVWVPQSSSVGPCLVRVIVCKMKGQPASVPTLSQINSLKRTNNAAVSSGTYSSTITTQLTPYNDEFWEVHSVTDRKLGKASFEGAGSSNQTPNNDFSLSVDFDINLTSFLKKDIQFDDTQATSNVQVNDGFVILVMCLDYNEAVPVPSVTTPRMDSSLCLTFTDA